MRKVLTSNSAQGLEKQLNKYSNQGYRLRGCMWVVPTKTIKTPKGTETLYEYGMLVYKGD